MIWNSNIVRDAVIVVFVDSFTSFIASFAIFSIIGYGAYILERPVESVVEAGTGLAFIVYPKVLTQFPGSVAFSILFFIMCLTLGLDSEVCPNIAFLFYISISYFPVQLCWNCLHSHPRPLSKFEERFQNKNDDFWLPEFVLFSARFTILLPSLFQLFLTLSIENWF